jgi:hypothetical protein
MNTEIVTIADLAVGETGKIVSGKFAGREFRVRSIGTQGRLVMVDWFGSADIGSIRSTTAVEVELPEPCADCALGWGSLCDTCTARAASLGSSITAEIERTESNITGYRSNEDGTETLAWEITTDGNVRCDHDTNGCCTACYKADSRLYRRDADHRTIAVFRRGEIVEGRTVRRITAEIERTENSVR